MAAPWRVSKVRALDDGCSILVCFTDGLEGVVRIPPDFFQGVFSHLCDPEKFREVSVVDGAVTWPGGFDIAPERIKGVEYFFQTVLLGYPFNLNYSINPLSR